VSIRPSFRSDLESVDWDFADADGASELGAFHWYPGRFVAHVPGVLIARLTPDAGRVLDPFCGSGTTLLEAKRFGREAVGIDVNPAACLMASAKLASYHPQTFDAWRRAVVATVQEDAVFGFGWHDWTELERSAVPNYDENARWYHPRTLRELSAIWRALKRWPSAEYSVVGDAAFSSILIGCCSQQKDWGWVCDNVAPKTFVEHDAIARFGAALEAWAMGQTAFEQTRHHQELPVDVVCADAARHLERYEDGCFDAVVTSPPYLNMTDYVRSQRLSFLWFERWNFDAARGSEIGARYKRTRKESLNNFVDEMALVARQMARVTRRGGFCAMVAGESPHHPRWLHRYESVLEQAGFTIEQRLSRSLPRQRAKRPVLQGESILVMRRS
jgi:DNA modification methylase